MRILFTGDVMLGRLVNNLLDRENYTYVWGDTLEIIRNADLSLINLECAISSRGNEWNKTFKMFHFRADPEAIRVLSTAYIDYVSLANNHVLDYDIEALFDTLDMLEKKKIAYSGAGRDLTEAVKPAILEPKNKPRLYDTHDNDGIIKRNKSISRGPNIRIGIVSLTDNQPEWEASGNSPGINYIPINLSSSNSTYYDRLRYSIANARSISDIVIVSSHVGPHFRESPSREYSNFARSILDLGADIYWGHSNHMPQGIEIYNKKIIMYDCGDFIDDYAVHSDYRNDLSFIFLLHLEEDYCVTDSTGTAFNYKKYNNNNNSGEVKRSALYTRQMNSSLRNHNFNDIKNHRANHETPVLTGNIELIPTKISDFRVNTALLEEADLSINRMVDRCNHLGTKCNVDTLRKRVIIPL